MNTDPLRELAHAWRSEAKLYRRRGQPALADMAESYAGDLAERLREWELELLTLEDAADELGISYAAIQKRVARGAIPNVGRDGKPVLRRCDLFGPPGPRLEEGTPDLAAEVLASRAAT